MEGTGLYFSILVETGPNNLLRKEYEHGETAEAKFVKGDILTKNLPSRRSLTPNQHSDLDRFEMASQGDVIRPDKRVVYRHRFIVALEYERNHGASTLQSFFDSSIPQVRHPEAQQWGRDLMEERNALHLQRTKSSP